MLKTTKGKLCQTKTGTRNKGNKWNTVTNKVAISPTVSIITLKVKVLMYQLKDRLPQCIKQQDSTECYLQETNFKQKDT